jgi:hypothetical protein
MLFRYAHYSPGHYATTAAIIFISLLPFRFVSMLSLLPDYADYAFASAPFDAAFAAITLP